MEDKRTVQELTDNHIDDHVDDEIKRCFSEESPKSFFMFAGAGSGKTRSLINALSFLDKKIGSRLSTHSKQVAVITYTNAACDEISKRLQYKPIFAVSTIHSFLWELIKNYQTDIKTWVIESLKKDIAELNEKQIRRRGGDAAIRRVEEIKKKTTRLAKIETVKKFSYSPNGNDVGYDSLNHSEVVKMGSDFIATEETMQEILVSKYPVLLIDESQDTKKELVDALFVIYEKYKDRFVIGMFGDTMQRIYMDGKDNLAGCIPDEWEKPKKVMNHRSATRIVELANAIRKTMDKQQQRSRSDSEAGTVRLFIADSSANKEEMECRAAQIMAEKANDKDWIDSAKYKSLILEHHMAASRFGFFDLYAPLNESKSFGTSLRDGSISEISFMANVVSPLIKAYKNNNDFEVSRIIRQHSPLLNKKAFRENLVDQTKLLEAAENAVEELLFLWEGGAIPTCIEILKTIKKTNLFTLNDRVDDILSEPIEDEDKKVAALREAFSVSFDELEKYLAYVTDNTQFATHQGVKGLEFPRVMVIMDDAEAKGFLFSYEKLFGAKSRTDTDIENEREGRDTGIRRTTRLFYVACTRAEKSLAIIAYTENGDAVRDTAISNDWFSAEEIVLL
ncbi:MULTISPECIES: UvrD-helicase domain-containing protein [Dethiosulfovibrio]|uniref:DNA 3'-5' helicase n=2 Tax=Dethiosulfovibrio TaxID=47054 RepID=A0ABS9ER61_9BACT|nr:MULTISPECIES: UvrD-helicase domain-containing protein [Dethiosulfovibrio]MCF4115220.1 AAA family ATPase [Dethiosulfovibrio russensis]MCF4143683.1 AAA family ATPase [Dethiosulfovibrio marinus]MCF4146180.1 AAA family ATPase [Dethiosulfovibrio acidaminovorans]